MNNLRRTGFSMLVFLPFYSGMSHSSVQEYEEIIYYHSDALGSPIAATNVDGDLLWREEYSPYGSRMLHESRESDCSSGVCAPVVSLWDEKQWFTGKLEEASNGVQYFGARWYEPELGRFLSVDPVPFHEGNMFTFNRYAYANNNPYKFMDPDGREVVQVGASFTLPEVLGVFQKLIGRDIEVSGFTVGVAWSSPNVHGAGEYDIGMYLTTRLNGEGVDTGRLAFSYSESVDDGDSVKDLAGVGGGTSVGFGLSGLNTSYSGEGIEMIGFHIGPGVGVTVQGEATIVYSNKHGKIEWNSSSQDNNSKAKERKKNED
jgi:RHS repeat-associated protein